MSEARVKLRLKYGDAEFEFVGESELAWLHSERFLNSIQNLSLGASKAGPAAFKWPEGGAGSAPKARPAQEPPPLQAAAPPADPKEAMTGWVTTREAARALGLDATTLSGTAKDFPLERKKVGREVFYLEEEVLLLLEARRQVSERIKRKGMLPFGKVVRAYRQLRRETRVQNSPLSSTAAEAPTSPDSSAPPAGAESL